VGLMKSNRPNVAFRAILIVIAGWVPLFLLSAVQSAFWHDGSLASFLTDFGVQARTLVAAPLLIVSEAVCLPPLSRIGAHFVTNGLIAPADEPLFARLVTSTRRLLDSLAVEIAICVLAIGIGASLAYFVPPDAHGAWHRAPSAGGVVFSPAGWWNVLVTLPLQLVLVLAWFWRLMLWTRFLFRVSRLRLRLIAAHPDHAGGLRFIEISLQTFALLGFSFAVIPAGVIANQMVHYSAPIATFQYGVAGFEFIIITVIAGPLLFFIGQLLDNWCEGVLAYGSLASSLGSQLEKKWFSRPTEAEALETNDFSATTDLYAIVANVYTIKALPLTLTRLAVFVVATLVPYLPLLLIEMPFSLILQKIAGVLL